MLKKKKFYLAISLLFVLGLCLGIFLSQSYKNQTSNEPYATPRSCPYHYINPNRCEPIIAEKKKEYIVLRNDLVEYINQQKQTGKLTSVSVYFRDLENGPILNIDEQEYFIPASLLKLPLLITYYKKAEDDQSLLQREVTVPSNIKSLPQNIGPQKTAEIGKTYTIDQLINLLITQSDNTSWEMLLTDLRKNYSEEDFISTLSDLGIVDPRKKTDQQYITVQSYAAIFRMLYNSSYLNLEMSDKALKLLTQTYYKNGLVSGVPTGIQIAHKFGEQKNGTEQQLHDCGIIYYSPDPYILCVMTKGTTIEDLEPVIQQISQKVYTEVKSRN